MAERRKGEESQRTDAPDPADLEDRIRMILEEHGFIVENFSLASAPVDVDVDIKAKLAEIPVTVHTAGAYAIQASSRVNRPGTYLLPELDVPFERDDAYYDEVRQAVGRGAPSVLLGTSNRALEQSLEKLRTVHGASGASQTASRQPWKRGQAEPMISWWALVGEFWQLFREVFRQRRSDDNELRKKELSEELKSFRERASQERSSTKNPTGRPDAEH